MRIFLATIFGLIAGAVIGLIAGSLMGLVVLLTVGYPAELSAIDRVGLSFNWVGLTILSLPVGLVIGGCVGAAQSLPWLPRVLLGAGLGLLIGLGVALYLSNGYFVLPLTFILVGTLLGVIQATLTVLIDKVLATQAVD